MNIFAEVAIEKYAPDPETRRVGALLSGRVSAPPPKKGTSHLRLLLEDLGILVVWDRVPQAQQQQLER